MQTPGLILQTYPKPRVLLELFILSYVLVLLILYKE